MLNEQQFHKKWSEIRGGVRNLWGRLSEEELDETQGNLIAISRLVEDKYDETKDAIKRKLDTLMNSFENDTDKGNIGLESSFQRAPEENPGTPNALRTSGTSQIQDIKSDIQSRTPVRKAFDEKSFEARKKDIGSAAYNGAAENKPVTEKDPEDRITRH